MNPVMQPDPNPEGPGPTIVPSPPNSHKGGRRIAAMLLLLVTSSGGVAWSQSARSVGVSWGQVASTGAAGALYLAPRILDWGSGPPPCAPCDRAQVPGFDRWIIGNERDGWSLASTGGVALLGTVTAIASLHAPEGRRRVTTAVEAASWAVAVTEIVKTVTDRNRPVLYTVEAPAAAEDVDNQRSFPSGHAAAAFALATSYALHEDVATELRLAALLGAAGVAAMRVLARRHFPSDVVAGGALGVVSAVVVKEIRF